MDSTLDDMQGLFQFLDESSDEYSNLGSSNEDESEFHPDNESVYHIMNCNSDNCQDYNCRYIKLLAFHYSICPSNNLCVDCNSFQSILAIHEQICPNKCYFIYCKSMNDFHINPLILPDQDHNSHDTKPLSPLTPPQFPPPPPLPNQVHIQTPIDSKPPEMLLPIKWIQCTKCHQYRKVPEMLDVARLPHFECNLNIWDPPFSKCSVLSEDRKSSKLIDLQGNYIEYETEKEEFMQSLSNYLKQDTGNLSLRTPTLGRKEVDLYRLFREVTAYGGSQSVVEKEGTWAKIYRGMENFSPTETSASFRLKKMYTKYLSGYETYLFHFVNPKVSNNKNNHNNFNNNGNTNNSNTSNINNNNINTIKQKINYSSYIPKEWKCTECGQINGPGEIYCTNCHEVMSLTTEHKSPDNIFVHHNYNRNLTLIDNNLDEFLNNYNTHLNLNEIHHNFPISSHSNTLSNNSTMDNNFGNTNNNENNEENMNSINNNLNEVNLTSINSSNNLSSLDLPLYADANIIYTTPHLQSTHFRHLSDEFDLMSSGSDTKFDLYATNITYRYI